MKDLIATIRPLARRLAAQQRRMKTAGLFANDRELLDCPHCGLREDVLISGLLITYREPGFHQDTGLRFQELTADTFRCPSCGQTVCEPFAEDKRGGAFPRKARNQAPQTRRTCKRREAQSMSAKPGTAAPTGRNKPAQGKERSDGALGHASQNTASPEGAKEGGELPRGWSEQRIEQLFAPLEDGRTLHQGWSPQCDKIPSPSEEVWGVLKTTLDSSR